MGGAYDTHQGFQRPTDNGLAKAFLLRPQAAQNTKQNKAIYHPTNGNNYHLL
jgi:hypothetical protein